MKPSRLVMPALRWRPETGFRHEERQIEATIADGVGGFIVFGGTVSDLRSLTDHLHHLAGRPLLIAADLERGAGQQVAGLPELPPPLALAALGDPALVRAAGRLTARAARRVGINWVLAPVADLDVEPANPIVQTRSFGSEPERVAGFVAEWIRGAREEGVLACAKHFPGHGRTVHDSHDRLPTVTAPAALLESSDLVPFRAAVAVGVDAVMTAHVGFPGLDPTGTPATRSLPILRRLREGMGFEGLIVSDALIMEGFAGGLGSVPAALAALRAGVDVLLYPPDPGATVAALEDAAEREPEFHSLTVAALSRYYKALERATGRFEAPVDAAEAPEAAAMAMAAALVEQDAPALGLRAPVELVVVDDDVDGAYAPSPNDWLERSLRAAGVPLGQGGSRVLLAFAEPRASKGRAGFGERSLERMAAAMPADLVVLFAHPRLVGQLPAGVPHLLAWHRQRLMQEAVADWLEDRLA